MRRQIVWSILTLATAAAACGDGADTAGVVSDVDVDADADADASSTTTPVAANPTDPPTSSTTTPPAVATTTLPPTAAEWTQHAAEDCRCADGSPYHYWTRAGDPAKVVLYLQGGGACFDAATCAFDSGLYRTNAGSARAVGHNTSEPPTGIFDFDNPDNPFREWSFVFVPYCTGDFHLGTRSHSYGGGLEVDHHGFSNAEKGLSHLLANHAEATEVFVAGSSAGAAPAPLFAGLVADALPQASVSALGDAAGGYPSSPDFNLSVDRAWGSLGSKPDWPAAAGLGAADWGIPDLYTLAGLQHPELRLARLDSAHDPVQLYYADLAGIGGEELLAVLDATEAAIEASGVDLSVFVAPGTGHRAHPARSAALLHPRGRGCSVHRLVDRLRGRRYHRRRSLCRLRAAGDGRLISRAGRWDRPTASGRIPSRRSRTP